MPPATKDGRITKCNQKNPAALIKYPRGLPKPMDLAEYDDVIKYFYFLRRCTQKQVWHMMESAFRLGATEKQYSGYLGKIDKKVNITKHQWSAIYPYYAALRSTSTKDEAIGLRINGNYTINPNKLKRTITKHVLPTEQSLMKPVIKKIIADFPKAKRHAIDIFEVFILDDEGPIVMVPIPIKILETLPIQQVKWPLLRLCQWDMEIRTKRPLELGRVANSNYFRHLRRLLYRLSNNLDFYPEIDTLLDKVKESGFQSTLKILLSIESTTTLAVKKSLLPILLVREDLELFKHILESSPFIRVDWYRILTGVEELGFQFRFHEGTLRLESKYDVRKATLFCVGQIIEQNEQVHWEVEASVLLSHFISHRYPDRETLLRLWNYHLEPNDIADKLELEVARLGGSFGAIFIRRDPGFRKGKIDDELLDTLMLLGFQDRLCSYLLKSTLNQDTKTVNYLQPCKTYAHYTPFEDEELCQCQMCEDSEVNGDFNVQVLRALIRSALLTRSCICTRMKHEWYIIEYLDLSIPKKYFSMEVLHLVMLGQLLGQGYDLDPKQQEMFLHAFSKGPPNLCKKEIFTLALVYVSTFSLSQQPYRDSSTSEMLDWAKELAKHGGDGTRRLYGAPSALEQAIHNGLTKLVELFLEQGIASHPESYPLVIDPSCVEDALLQEKPDIFILLTSAKMGANPLIDTPKNELDKIISLWDERSVKFDGEEPGKGDCDHDSVMDLVLILGSLVPGTEAYRETSKHIKELAKPDSVLEKRGGCGQSDYVLTAMQVVSEKSDLELMQYFVQTNPMARDQITRKYDSSTSPLIWAIVQDSISCLKYLVENGADVNAAPPSKNLQGARGRTDQAYLVGTPLQTAAMTGNLDITRYLIEHGASAGATWPEAAKEECRVSAVEIAVHYHRLDIVALFLHIDPQYRDLAIKLIAKEPFNYSEVLQDYIFNFKPSNVGALTPLEATMATLDYNSDIV